MKILELFCGYGTASFALKQLGIPYECVGYSDIDKYANQCFAQNHISLNTIQERKDYFENPKELGDVKNINPNELEDFDLLTGGFPCQAFSVAGKGLGELDTRGTLFREIIKIAEVKQPRYMLLENVKGLTNKNHKATFDKKIANTLPSQFWKQGKQECLNLVFAIRSFPRKGKGDLNRFQRVEFRLDGCSNSLTSVQKDNLIYLKAPRRFTPKECFRIQGFINDEVNLEGLSDTQKYKLAGNGQSVNVVKKIFERMFK